MVEVIHKMYIACRIHYSSIPAECSDKSWLLSLRNKQNVYSCGSTWLAVQHKYHKVSCIN